MGRKYGEIVDRVSELGPDELSRLSEGYWEFLREIRDEYGAMIHGMGPVSGPLEPADDLYDVDMGVAAGTVGVALGKSKDGEEFIEYLENDVMEQDENWETATRSVVEQAFPELLDDLED